MTMTQKIVKCGLIGGVILFIWGTAAWTILPWQKHQLRAFNNEGQVSSAIYAGAPQDGIYVLPRTNPGYDNDASRYGMAQSPYIFAAVSLSGRNTSQIRPVIQSLLVKILSACLAAWLVIRTKHEHSHIVKFVTVIGILIAIAATFPYVIWFGFPATFIISSFIEIVFGWFFASLAMAKILA